MAGLCPNRWAVPMVAPLFALFAGMLTIAAPCTLPVLPVLLGSSVGQTSRARPLLIALGFVVSFTVAAVVFSSVTQILGLDADRLRTLAIGLLLAFGLLMLWPRPFERLAARAGEALSHVHRILTAIQDGNAGGFVLGTTL